MIRAPKVATWQVVARVAPVEPEVGVGVVFGGVDCEGGRGVGLGGRERQDRNH